MVVFFFMVIVVSTKAKQITNVLDRGKAAYRVMTNDTTKTKKD